MNNRTSILVVLFAAVGCLGETATEEHPGEFDGPSAATLAMRSSPTFASEPLPERAEAFEVVFNATPSASKMDGITGLGRSSTNTFSELAAIVRFAPSGFLDARDGSGYRADTAIRYNANESVEIRIRVRTRQRRYDVFVTTPSEAEAVLGQDFEFRSDARDLDAIDRVAVWAGQASHVVSDLRVDGRAVDLGTQFPTFATTGPPSPPTKVYAGVPFGDSWQISTPGIVLDGFIFDRCLSVQANNVTIRNSIVRCHSPGNPLIHQRTGGSLVIENTELVGLKEDGQVSAEGVRCNDCTVRRSSVRGTSDGFGIGGQARLIENMIGQLADGLTKSGSATHNDAIQIYSGSPTIVRNTIEHDCLKLKTGDCNAAIFLQGDEIEEPLISNNLFRKWDAFNVIYFHKGAKGSVEDNHFEGVIGARCNAFAGGIYRGSGNRGTKSSDCDR